jgi:hypothetical protein
MGKPHPAFVIKLIDNLDKFHYYRTSTTTTITDTCASNLTAFVLQHRKQGADNARTAGAYRVA